jgi:hypothetical protein
MLDKNVYFYWYVGQNLNYYNDEKNATVTNPRHSSTTCSKICCDSPVYPNYTCGTIMKKIIISHLEFAFWFRKLHVVKKQTNKQTKQEAHGPHRSPE